MRAIIGFLLPCACLAQFDVASVKPSAPDSRGMSASTEAGRFTARNVTLKFLVHDAYHVKEFEVSGGPKWVDSQRFDIDATAPAGADMKDCLRLLLEERFHLQVHHEARAGTAFDLTIAKGGVKAARSREGAGRPGINTSRGRIVARRAGMAQLADTLSNLLAQIVTDRTGLDGAFDFQLDWTPDETQPVMAKPGVPPPTEKPADTGGPSLYTALVEQVGLKLEARKAQADVIVIDRAELPTAN